MKLLINYRAGRMDEPALLLVPDGGDPRRSPRVIR